jgi:hypothetical protein
MKKSLLFLSMVFCLNTFITLGQSLTPQAVPSTQVGTPVTINFTYTSNVACAVYAELRIANIDGAGVITQDYSVGSNYIVGAFSSLLPVSSSESTTSVTITVPANATPSSNLPQGKTYSWVYKLTPGINDYNEVGNTFQFTSATITSTNDVVDTLNLVNPPSEITAGSTVSVTVNYTCPESRLVKFGIALYDANGFISDLVGVGVDNLPATTNTPVELSQDLIIPSNAVPSAALPAGQFYKVDTALFTPGFASYISGASSNVTLNVSMSVGNYEYDAIKIYPNPVSDNLFISDITNVKSLKIYDLVGNLLKVSNDLYSNTVDVSNLKTGVYFLSFDDTKTIRFIKK